MAMTSFRRLLSPLMQYSKYSTNNNVAIVRRDKFINGLLINVRGYQSSSNKSERPEEELVKKDVSSEKNITLVFPGGARSLMTLEEAERIANKRNCELVSVQDDFDCGMVYRLISTNSKESNKAGKANKVKPTKEAKIIEISTTTTERDLLIKCKKVVKLVQSNNNVFIRVNNVEQQNKTTVTPPEKVIEILKEAVQEFGTIKAMNKSPKKITFTIVPQTKAEPSE